MKANQTRQIFAVASAVFAVLNVYNFAPQPRPLPSLSARYWRRHKSTYSSFKLYILTENLSPGEHTTLQE